MVAPTSSKSTGQREVAAEQAFVDGVYARLDEAARSAQALAAEGHGRARLGHEGGLVERDAMVFQAAKRIAALNAAHEGLVFGRLDLVDGAVRHVGRLGLRDADREVLLIDWRAPAAGVFYSATAQEPSGVVRRRVLRCRGARVTGVEDELLDAEAAPPDLAVVGEGALLASISRARDSSMHSVVATIQKEQDEAIRAPSRGVTTIGGGPGTGKTVVALHRAAYLLYVDRRRFESGGVLIVGPSGIFMSYIERVLPSLGETAVTLRSLGEVVDGVRAVRHDTPLAAAVKGSARMRQVLARAVRDQVPGAPTELRTFYRDDVLMLAPHDLRRLRRSLLRNGQQRNRAQPKVERAVVDALWRQVSGPRALDLGRERFTGHLLDDDSFTAFVRSWWPPVDAVEAWTWLQDPERLQRYAAGLLSTGEVAALAASWSAGTGPAIEDVPLIDELRYLLGDVAPETQRDDSDNEVKQQMSFERADAAARLRTTLRTEDDPYAHVLVDEAQDLSPMQWRMLARRGRHASWTIVGDPAQSSWPAAAEADAARAEALSGKQQHAFRLSTNYRNSAEIFGFAAEVASLAVPDPDLPQAVRSTGSHPEHLVVAAAHRMSAVRSAALELAGTLEGSVAVVTPVGLRVALAKELADLVSAAAGRIRVLDALDTKGLEFDGVVVAEPGQIVTESPTGWRTLYVVLTRATQRLVTVSTDAGWLDRVRATGR
ncbi:MAG: HelD family protein [Nocardioidaceae bacterium]